MVLPVFKALPETAAIPDYSPWRPDHAAGHGRGCVHHGGLYRHQIRSALRGGVYPGVREYLIPSHQGKEPAAVKLADALQLSPVIHAGMALGEGTGAVYGLRGGRGLRDTASDPVAV